MAGPEQTQREELMCGKSDDSLKNKQDMSVHMPTGKQVASGVESGELVAKVPHPIRQFSENVASDLGLE